MEKVKVLIADDDYRISNAIETILNQHFLSIEIVAHTDSVDNTTKALYELKPHVAILDIHLYGGTAMEVVKNTNDLDYKVIFMSAYQEYALEDIRFASIDFIYKPLDISELLTTVDQVLSCLVEEGYKKKIQTFFNNTDIKGENKQIVIKSTTGITSVPINDIVCGESNFGKSRFYFVSKKTIEATLPLRRYESLLHSYLFYRCHTNYVINLNHVRKIDYNSHIALMSNGMSIPSDSRRFDGLINKLEELMAKNLSLSTTYRLS